MEDKQNRSGWIFIAVAVIITGTALVVNTLATSPPKADTELQQHESIIREIFPKAGDFPDGFERMETHGEGFVYTVLQGGNTLGYAVQQTVQGYGGPIELVVGFLPDYTVAGVHVGGAEFNETEGLGAKAKEPAFTDQFKNAHLPVSLGGGIDAIAGATVTTQAVIGGVNQAAERLFAMPGMAVPQSSAAPVSERTANASVIGYGGPVLVRLTLDERNAIQALDIGGARFMETEGVGSRIRDESFVQQFIGKTPPLELDRDIDVISGATVSSTAALEAVNEAAAFLMQKEAPSDTARQN